MPAAGSPAIPSPDEAKYSFLDDYSEGAHPAVLAALQRNNESREAGYGRDRFSEAARGHIRRHLGVGDEVGIFFVPSGTAANAIGISACLRPHEAVIAASTGHIVTREAGAVEAGGHKIIVVADAERGKLTPETVARAVDENWHFPHVARPRLVYLSQATETGTVYTRAELVALKRTCEACGLLLFLDGARLGCALASACTDVSVRDIYDLTDVFWIGGTKNGTLLGEAVVVKHPQIARDFEFLVKQRGALLAKGRAMGVQFAELFRGRGCADDCDGGEGCDVDGGAGDRNGEDDACRSLFLDLATRANRAADRLSRAIVAAGFRLRAETETNQVFAVLPLALVEILQRSFHFYVWEKGDDDCAVVRLLTTWATDPEQLERFSSIVMRWEGGYKPVHTTPGS